MKITQLILSIAILIVTIDVYLNTKNKQEVNSIDTSSPGKALETFFSNDFMCPIKLTRSTSSEYKDTLSKAIIYSLPEAPDPNLPTRSSKDRYVLFDKTKGTDNEEIYLPNDFPNGWDEREIDIDGDNIKEKVMITYLYMTKGPHLLRIVKDGYIIFEYRGQGVDIDPIYNDPRPGFILKYYNDMLVGDGVVVRYVVEDDGLIKPIWQQKHCGLEV